MGRISDPVDCAQSQFLELLRWCSNLQGFDAATCSNSQELSPQADAQYRSALPVPSHQPVQLGLEPVQVWLMPFVYAHWSPQHQRDAVRAFAWVRQAVATVRPQGLEVHSPFPRQLSHQFGPFVVNVLDHQQRGAQSSR